MTIFSNDLYVDARFKGSASIKNILPVLVPELTYKRRLKSKLFGITLGIMLLAMAVFPIFSTYIFGQIVTMGSYRYTNQILF